MGRSAPRQYRPPDGTREDAPIVARVVTRTRGEAPSWRKRELLSARPRRTVHALASHRQGESAGHHALGDGDHISSSRPRSGRCTGITKLPVLGAG